MVKPVLAMSESTYRALCYSDADCLSSVRTYLLDTVLQRCRLFKRCQNHLPGTVLQGCRLFKQCQNLPAGHCVTEVQAVLAMSESTCRALCNSGADCLSSVRTYLPGTVLQVCRLFKRCLNLPTGQSGEACFSNIRVYLPSTVLQWYRLFKQCQNLPARHCVTAVQTV